jgi:ubiquinone/menaquinone biosynthesis C-methylase UbiE
MDIEEAAKVLAEFGDDADDYEKNLLRHDPLYENLIERAGIEAGSKVLELGTGSGPVAIKLAQLTGPKGEVLGIDVNERMLSVANEKKELSGFANVDFKLMSMEKLELPDKTFDHVISSFGVCCCLYYDRTLRETYRVLNSGGKITFNQEGPHGPDQVFYEVLSKHMPEKQSELLRKKRQAETIHSKLTEKYSDPFTLLSLMRDVGFKNSEASITNFEMVFPTVEEYMDYLLFKRLSFEEMNIKEKQDFNKECTALLMPLAGERGLVRDWGVIYYTGYKKE